MISGGFGGKEQAYGNVVWDVSKEAQDRPDEYWEDRLQFIKKYDAHNHLVTIHSLWHRHEDLKRQYAVTLQVRGAARQLTAKWYNPRSGQQVEIDGEMGDGSHEFQPPDDFSGGDAVLYLSR
jgi:hypothetical protein